MPSLSQSLVIVLLSWALKLFLSHLLDIPNFSCKVISASMISSPVPCAGNPPGPVLEAAPGLGTKPGSFSWRIAKLGFKQQLLVLVRQTPMRQTNLHHPGTSAPRLAPVPPPTQCCRQQHAQPNQGLLQATHSACQFSE